LGENFCQLYIWQRFNNQNIQGAQKIILQRICKALNKWENGIYRQLSKEVQMANKYMRFHFTPVRLAIIYNINNNKCWQGCRKKESLYNVIGNVNCLHHYGNQYGGSPKK
jgi:hypothetical protein